jgi:enterochelin esterase-like enzyme
MALQNWVDQTDTTKYSPFDYKPGMMRGAGSYDAEMTEVVDGYWMIEVPVTAGATQYWFSKDGNYSGSPDGTWLYDPNAPTPVLIPTDGLGYGDITKRASFNVLHVPYAESMGDLPEMAARNVEVPQEGIPHGSWSYVDLPADINEPAINPEIIPPAVRQIGIYLPPNYDSSGATKYKTIYVQHGGSQDASDWMNIGSVPHIMDNLIAAGKTEPAIVISPTYSNPNTDYVGYLGSGFENVPKIIAFMEANYNAAPGAENRSFGGLSGGSRVTAGIIGSEYVDLFKYYGVWSGGMQELVGHAFSAGSREPMYDVSEEHLQDIYILAAHGNRDSPLSAAILQEFFGRAENGAHLQVAGAHDFNTWNQIFAIYATEYLWKPAAFNSSSR